MRNISEWAKRFISACCDAKAGSVTRFESLQEEIIIIHNVALKSLSKYLSNVTIFKTATGI